MPAYLNSLDFLNLLYHQQEYYYQYHHPGANYQIHWWLNRRYPAFHPEMHRYRPTDGHYQAPQRAHHHPDER